MVIDEQPLPWDAEGFREPREVVERRHGASKIARELREPVLHGKRARRHAQKVQAGADSVRESGDFEGPQIIGCIPMRCALYLQAMKSTQLHPRTLARLKSALQRHGIPQKSVASAAGVSKHMVCHVLAGRAVSANVVDTAKRLIEAEKQNGRPAVETSQTA